MDTPKYSLIASTPLWMATLETPPRPASEVQNTLTDYVTKTGHTVVGYNNEETGQVTLLRWPDLRPNYLPPSPEECNQSRDDLAKLLGATTINLSPIPDGMIHCMMGRRVGGYDVGRIASMEEIRSIPALKGVQEVHMISARTKADGTIESYGEPAAAVTLPVTEEHHIHQLGDTLEQHHYVIERTTQNKTDFYETLWVNK